MGLIYEGDCTFQEAEGSGQLTVDQWGFDVLTRIRVGRIDQLDAELALYKSRRDIKDSDYPALTLMPYTVERGRAFARVTLPFRGVLDGNPRSPEPKPGLRTKQATIEQTGDTPGETNGTTCTFTYIAPYATFHYVSKDKPTGPKYKNKLDLNLFQIRHMTGDSTRAFKFIKGGDFNGATSSATLSGLANTFNAVIDIETTQFDYPKVGQWYEVTETNEAVLLPLGIANLKRLVK